MALSSILCACGTNSSVNPAGKEVDSSNTTLDSALDARSSKPGAALPEIDEETKAKKQLTEAIFSSKSEINLLETDISDSLTKSGLSSEKRSLFSKTIQQLEASSDILNKQLEQILVSDLQASRERLGGIITKMKGSQSELQTMITRLDKITAYLQTATDLIQTLSPIKPIVKPAAKPKG